VPIRGNVGTRLQKLVDNAGLDGIILALAGLKRLGYAVELDGSLSGKDVPAGLFASILPIEQMLPCVGQAALGFESRSGDREIDEIVQQLNDEITMHCVTAERAFLHGMGGGCMSPVAAYGEILDGALRLRAVSFRNEQVSRADRTAPASEAKNLGKRVAEELT
jgi:hydroxymethylbilane synthase